MVHTCQSRVIRPNFSVSLEKGPNFPRSLVKRSVAKSNSSYGPGHGILNLIVMEGAEN